MRSEPEIAGVVVTADHQLLRCRPKPQIRPEVHILQAKIAGDLQLYLTFDATVDFHAFPRDRGHHAGQRCAPQLRDVQYAVGAIRRAYGRELNSAARMVIAVAAAFVRNSSGVRIECLDFCAALAPRLRECLTPCLARRVHGLHTRVADGQVTEPLWSVGTMCQIAFSVLHAKWCVPEVPGPVSGGTR